MVGLVCQWLGQYVSGWVAVSVCEWLGQYVSGRVSMPVVGSVCEW